MEEILSLKKVNEPLTIGLGFFDCVHMGHRKLIERVFAVAKANNTKTAIVTFSNNPYKIFNAESKIIYTYKERLSILSELGMDYCIPFKFDSAFKQTSKDDFLEMIFSSFNISALVCGYDYLFGAQGEGDANYLDAYCKKKNIELSIVDKFTQSGVRVSSTLIKELLLKGEIEQANKFLLKPYFVKSVVEKGNGNGRTINFPTANQSLSKDKLIIKNGVYGTLTEVDGVIKKSVTNVGAKPTYNDLKITIETYIENENIDLYNKEITVEFIKYIRDIKTFSSPMELKEQIQKDLSWK